MNGRKARVRRWTWSFTAYARASRQVVCTAEHGSLSGGACSACHATI